MCCGCQPPAFQGVRSQRASGSARPLPGRAAPGGEAGISCHCPTISVTPRWNAACIRRLRAAKDWRGGRLPAVHRELRRKGVTRHWLGGVPRHPSRRVTAAAGFANLSRLEGRLYADRCGRRTWPARAVRRLCRHADPTFLTRTGEVHAATVRRSPRCVELHLRRGDGHAVAARLIG